MALDAQLTGKRVYLDSNVFIYAFENSPGFGKACVEILHLIDGRRIDAVTSEISLIEILAGPLMAGARDLAALYAYRLDHAAGLSMAPVSRPVILRGASIRANRRLKIPDALHIATALDTGCDILVTADTGIPASPKLPVLYLAAG